MSLRPILIPVTFTLDKTGAATIPIPLEKTGDWRNVKIALGTTGPAEWAVLRSGMPVTFGRGRRVTLGPELCEPFDTLSVTVVGGPPNAAGSGSASGVGGSMTEVMAGYAPAPNTIALDTAQGQILLGTIKTPGDGLPHTATFPVPTGSIQSVGISVLPGLVPNVASVKGDVTGSVYLTWPVVGNFASDVERWFLPDQNAICSVTDLGVPSQVNFLGFNFAPVTTVRSGGFPLEVDMQHASPALWQAASTVIRISGASLTSGQANAIQLVAPVPGASVFLFHCHFTLPTAASGGIHLDGQNSGGSTFRGDFSGAVTVPQLVSGDGAQGTPGQGLWLWSDANLLEFHGSLSYSQGVPG